ncbi:hypothetical protein E2C01_093753 [Portunus trituberculatus]|uniref:Uncharacterized protein n=1 Tax=Portunus trituberculatus TaxID=210409 RepID=A0A5B7K183_PORTR|nr:hypothetical protein [Portunus trituberculatus]
MKRMAAFLFTQSLSPLPSFFLAFPPSLFPSLPPSSRSDGQQKHNSNQTPQHRSDKTARQVWTQWKKLSPLKRRPIWNR